MYLLEHLLVMDLVTVEAHAKRVESHAIQCNETLTRRVPCCGECEI